jgi:isoquinoline 1-oxidoreductase beta subunit
MFYAAVSRCPVFGGKVKSFDATRTKSLPGVVNVYQISSGIAVVADSTYRAFKGKDALNIEWDYGKYANLNTEDIRNELTKHTKEDGYEFESKGDVKKEPEKSEKEIEALYEVPFLCHAQMEPMNCVARVENDKAEIWAPSQTPQDARTQSANALGMSEDNVTVHITLMGGGFGRRLVNDFAVEASEISKASGKPIKLTWTREEDMKFGWYLPPSMNVLKGSVSENGRPLKYSHHVIAPSIIQMRFAPNLPPSQYDIKEGAVGLQYQIPNMRISGTTISTHIPISWYRSVYNSQNPFASECFIDELAYAANKDPYEFRRDMLPDDSRLKNVLNVAADKSDWGIPLPKGKGRGIAIAECYESYNAQVAEVTIVGNKIKLDRYVVVVDCGIVVNPDIMESQMQGVIAFALSGALKGKITIRIGRVEQCNYDDYPILTYNEMPKVEVHYIKNFYKVGGIGEVGMAACPPALCNAIFAATGKRIRRLPIRLS